MIPLLLALAACTGGTLQVEPPEAIDADGDGWDADTDCDDSSYAVHPGADETCNHRDDDCDGLEDEDAVDAGAWYLDLDSDGWGSGAPVIVCDAPSGHVDREGDCDDGDASAYPGAPEICDGVDNDCDDHIDVDAVDAVTIYPDADGDGYGDETQGVASCDLPAGWTTQGRDCDDGQAAVHPGASERCNGRDDDCSGSLHWLEEDADGDGYPSCKLVKWVATDTSSYNDPSGTDAYGASDAAALLVSHGVTWESTDLATRDLDDGLLDETGMLVIYGQATMGALSRSESTALARWLDDGGSLVLFTGWHDTNTCHLVDSLPLELGISCETSANWSGQITTFSDHAITKGVSTACARGSETWELASPAAAVMVSYDYTFAVVSEVGDGRFVGFTDEWLLYNDWGRECDLGYGDHETLIDNTWQWLLDRDL